MFTTAGEYVGLLALSGYHVFLPSYPTGQFVSSACSTHYPSLVPFLSSSPTHLQQLYTTTEHQL